MHFDEQFWIVVAFIAFIALAVKYIFPPITRLLDKRADDIRTELEEATRLREEAQATLAAYQKHQREVLQEAEALLNKARDDANRFKQSSEQELKDALKRRKALAEERIGLAEKRAIEQVRANIVDVATKAATITITSHIEEKGSDTLVNQAIKDLESALHSAAFETNGA